MNRRRMQIGGRAYNERLKATNESYQRVGQSLYDSQLQQLQSQLDTFRANLEVFAREHRKDIQKDPVFRMHFQKMCANIGVDPLASSKGYWGELLGVGDFYYELGIQIIDVCLSTRALNGGLMELSEIKRRVERMRGIQNSNSKTTTTGGSRNNAPQDSNSSSSSSKWAAITLSNNNKDTSMEITEDDVLRAIKTLAPLGSGFQVLQLGDKKMVSSVPRELNRDQSLILALVQNTSGHINANMVSERLGWESGRIETALDTLLEDGLMWIDQQAEPYEYWVPGFFEPEDDEIYATTTVAASSS
ncbi:Vacuolar protein sorting-associated protein SNF8 [Lobosporangium transversale]|uniref:EAP30/Vps36 family-domain-containing protein n=1 Tax=Lobosporangium transversale TaxID=64571 RepID=A0A1Y2GTJ3_9FUNG|nr:EAP30/Vps36 family-domain-containing protein [Lobosporangium transversale]KAF9914783.1 Vacuolar protein sorting-associated protein SNF8 [Lobosporangium transversale]ORZ22798.1 EAP30/Vps36 family-domain-containing protein [Lobosporangium transversale]|eukprot:XP_021883352.1 EAP30/Vps36 family-domain-containing protein [Lobosporangium transversale]